MLTELGSLSSYVIEWCVTVAFRVTILEKEIDRG